MASKVELLCEENIKPIIEKLGYDVIEIEYAKKVDGMNLTFVIDNENGINLEDCEKVHKIIDEKLDELNSTNDVPYILNVSSVGIDRPIKNHKDFLRNKGKQVELKLFTPFEGKKSYIGELKNFTDSDIVIVVDSEEKVFSKEKVAQVIPVIKF